MDFLDTYLDARQREMDLARVAREARERRRRRTQGSRLTDGENNSSPLGDSLKRSALSLTRVMGTFPY
jgi:hypothetical protein